MCHHYAHTQAFGLWSILSLIVISFDASYFSRNCFLSSSYWRKVLYNIIFWYFNVLSSIDDILIFIPSIGYLPSLFFAWSLLPGGYRYYLSVQVTNFRHRGSSRLYVFPFNSFRSYLYFLPFIFFIGYVVLDEPRFPQVWNGDAHTFFTGLSYRIKKFRNIALKIKLKGKVNHLAKARRKAKAYMCVKSHPVTKGEL